MHASKEIKSCCAIIVAAGSSRRLGQDKLTWTLDGVTVLRRSIDAFMKASTIDSIIVVCPKDRWDQIDHENFTKPVTRIDGGKERQDSVAAGLAAIPADTQIVAVHDGARPLVSPHDIDRCVIAAAQFHAATLAHPATDTMKRSDENDFSTEPVDRLNLWCMETPQVFDAVLLRKACDTIARQGISATDEVSAVEQLGTKVKFVESHSPNLKITTTADLALAEALVKIQSQS
ncbi:MAG: 2-C-methyl-D-erythritol 4-phosphate cytidylyltransferase [Verrucomicrobiota bacterium]|jgi:2-C-methyl-D-erythritol 4-phosphate cytidylyltransferase